MDINNVWRYSKKLRERPLTFREWGVLESKISDTQKYALYAMNLEIDNRGRFINHNVYVIIGLMPSTHSTATQTMLCWSEIEVTLTNILQSSLPTV